MNQIIKTGLSNEDESIHNDLIVVTGQCTKDNTIANFYLITDKSIIKITDKIESMLINLLA